MQHGFGKEVWPDGAVYEGEFSYGKKHGKGKFIFPDKAEYNGDLRDNTI